MQTQDLRAKTGNNALQIMDRGKAIFAKHRRSCGHTTYYVLNKIVRY